MGVDLEKPSGEYQKGGNRCNMSVVGGYRGYHTNGDVANSPSTADMDKENAGCSVSKALLNDRKKAHGGDRLNLNSIKVFEPHDGMEFDSKEEAFTFYKEYAKSVGFATIIKASRRSRISGNFIDAKFVCTRYGNKKKTNATGGTDPVLSIGTMPSVPVKQKRGRINRSWSKTDCKACMHVKRNPEGRWIIRSLVKDHNHEIFPDQAYYIRGHRNLDPGDSNVDTLHAIRARTKKIFVSMSRRSSGDKKFECQKGGATSQVGSTQNLALEENDTRVMLDFLKHMQNENPYFFHALDLNEQQHLRNVFWVDAKGRLDFGSFGDVIFFDTTYIKNENKLPFAPFFGVNHHRQFILLGCALLSDETKSTYIWLMRSWLRAMGGHPPKVILTDQDRSLKEAIADVFPGTHHCFCLWHIFSKIPEKLSGVMRQHQNLMAKFNKCIFQSWTAEQFEKRWWRMADRFNLRFHEWFQSLYEDRKQWIPVYMKDIVLVGLSTTQRSESINSFFDKYIQRKTTLKEFIHQYEKIMQDKCEEEAKADFETWHKQPVLKSPSPFGKQMAELYTHAIFKKFQVEVLGVVACHPRKESEDGANKTFKVRNIENNQEFIVVWNETTSDISCLCRMFEFSGFLCRHVMIVLQMSGIHNIPSQYILKRFTKDAKSKQTIRKLSDVVLSRAERYNDLCRRAFELGDEGSFCEESYTIAFNALEKVLTDCENLNNSIQRRIEPTSLATQSPDDYELVDQGNSSSKTSRKNINSKSRQVHPNQEVISSGIHDHWQNMGHSNLEAPVFDCSYESHESMQGMENMNSRTPTVDGYFGPQQIVQGMGQMNSIAPSRDNFYTNQPTIQGQGQLNSIAPVHDVPYVTQQRMHGMEQLSFRPQNISSCFDIQDGLQNMGHSKGTTLQLHDMTSKHLRSEDPSQ